MDINDLIVLACVTLNSRNFTITHLLVLHYLLTDESGRGYELADVANNCLMTQGQAMEILNDLTMRGLVKYNTRASRRDRRFHPDEGMVQLFRSVAKLERFGVGR